MQNQARTVLLFLLFLFLKFLCPQVKLKRRTSRYPNAFQYPKKIAFFLLRQYLKASSEIFYFGNSTHILSVSFMLPAILSAFGPYPQKKSARTAP